MNEDNKNKQATKKSLLKLFRNALDEAMQRDPVQHIREAYQLETEDYRPINVVFLEKEKLKDPVQHIKGTYDQILGFKNDDTSDRENSQHVNTDFIQRLRETYQQMLDFEDDKANRENNKQKHRQPWWKRFF